MLLNLVSSLYRLPHELKAHLNMIHTLFSWISHGTDHTLFWLRLEIYASSPIPWSFGQCICGLEWVQQTRGLRHHVQNDLHTKYSSKICCMQQSSLGSFQDMILLCFTEWSTVQTKAAPSALRGNRFREAALLRAKSEKLSTGNKSFACPSFHVTPRKQKVQSERENTLCHLQLYLTLQLLPKSPLSCSCFWLWTPALLRPCRASSCPQKHWKWDL